MNLKHWKLLRNFSIIYVLLIIILFIANIIIINIVEHGYKPLGFVGCYVYDAMLVGFKCSGFLGSEILAIALNLPLYHFYMPLFVLFDPMLIFVVLALWFFPVMLLVSITKLRKRSSQ
ncbi:hypothetical protein OFY17_09020 [Marinomonas sp. C2222]|uniref:Uncharacterized protein n=1 Tax=Marinomonas sargassi TaxID=2984494 RepID=A0ABT2YT21_9GAMM|nr:hypothetical protein [Marinomonas sargassi]MCV2403016.1 hypothetical protein [Marinomonas sargassi]